MDYNFFMQVRNIILQKLKLHNTSVTLSPEVCWMNSVNLLSVIHLSLVHLHSTNECNTWLKMKQRIYFFLILDLII